MQETQVRCLDQEDPTCCGTTKPRSPKLLSLCSRAQEPQLLSPCVLCNYQTLPRACAPQQEKLPLGEARTPQRSYPPTHWPQLGKAQMQQQRPTTAKNKINK